METTIRIMVIGFAVAVIVYVEMFMNREALTEKEISDYQKILDRIVSRYGLKKHDAATELIRGRKWTEAFTLIFSGMLLAFLVILLVWTTTWLSLTNIEIMCISGIVLTSDGLMKVFELKSSGKRKK